MIWWAVGAAEPGRFVEGRAAEGRLGVDFCAKTISTLRKVADMIGMANVCDRLEAGPHGDGELEGGVRPCTAMSTSRIACKHFR